MANIQEILMDTLEMRESISGNKRKEQLHSRLLLQARYADWFNPHTYLGICRTLAQIIIPAQLVRLIKPLAKR